LTSEYQDLYDIEGNRFGWTFWSPRIGVTWDATGDGKTIAKASFAIYGDFMGVDDYNQMPGGTSGWLGFYWWDQDTDDALDFTELYWGGSGVNVPEYMPYQIFDASGNFLPSAAEIDDAYNWYYGGFADWATRNDLADPYDELATDYGSNRTTEFMLTVEREVFTDFAVTLNASYRRYDWMNWRVPFFPVGGTNYYQQKDWFVKATDLVSDATLPSNVDVSGATTMWGGDTGEANQHDWYVYDDDYTASDGTYLGDVSDGQTPYDRYERRPDYFRDYYGIDLIVNKRLSNKWMLNGSLTWQHQETHYGDEGFFDPTNLWALDGKPYAASIGASSGKINQYTYSRWLIKVGGLYQLPYDFNISFTFMAREGWILEERIRYYDYALPNANSRSYTAYINPFGELRLPTFYKIDIRLEKVITLGDTGRIYLMADLFNVLNSKLETRRYQNIWGTVYRDAVDRTPDGISFSTYHPWYWLGVGSNANHLYELLNPRVIRFGVRFQF
jgi:hypothetical protein